MCVELLGSADILGTRAESSRKPAWLNALECVYIAINQHPSLSVFPDVEKSIVYDSNLVASGTVVTRGTLASTTRRVPIMRIKTIAMLILRVLCMTVTLPKY